MNKDMKNVLITGAKGFVGRNLTARLKLRDDLRLLLYDIDNDDSDLLRWAEEADVVFHLAGVNRPPNVDDFNAGNADFTEYLCHILEKAGRKPRVVFSSTIQAEHDNPYGHSKRRAEDSLSNLALRGGATVAIFRLKNVFGKWSRPNYNSVVATFCHNIAHNLPIQISDPEHRLELVHIDDVVATMIEEMDRTDNRVSGIVPSETIQSFVIALGDLSERIHFFHEMRRSLQTPDLSDPFIRRLHSTYLSYVEPSQSEYGLDIKRDNRGSLAEFIKSPHFGQIFVSRTAPGVTRGNHYHHLKTEKFMVLAGEGLIRLRHIENDEVHEFRVRGEDYRVVDIPPGYTHSITNIGTDEMVTLFWADEIFDPARPDTYFLPVNIQDEIKQEVA